MPFKRRATGYSDALMLSLSRSRLARLSHRLGVRATKARSAPCSLQCARRGIADVVSTPGTTEELVHFLDVEPIESSSEFSQHNTRLQVYKGSGTEPGWGRLFGGQIMAQALAAAQQSANNSPAASIHCYFIRPGVVSELVLLIGLRDVVLLFTFYYSTLVWTHVLACLCRRPCLLRSGGSARRP